MMSTWEELDDTMFDEETEEEEEANLCLMEDIASKGLDSKLDRDIFNHNKDTPIMVPGQWLLMAHDKRKVYILMSGSYA